MSEIQFVDTSLRDGNQSLWDATGLTAKNILTCSQDMDQVGFKGIEIASNSNLQTSVRYHRENPWEKIRLVTSAMPNTPLSFGTTGYRFIGFRRCPDSILSLVIERMAANGIRRIWILDAVHEKDTIYKTARMAKTAGIEDVMVALSYSISPVHTDEYYAQKTKEITECQDVDTVFLKDQGGLLTPECIKTLVPAIQENLNERPLEIHSHCNTGLAPIVYLEAIKLGVNTVHTGIPPLANGTAQPSIFNVLKNISYMGCSANINMEKLEKVSEHLKQIAEKEGRPAGIPLEYDLSYYEHQVPGGMVSTLRRQLSEAKMEHRLPEVLTEIVTVRKELGYPIMVTPFSQFVATQSTMNVISSERYKMIPDGIIEYAAGYFGRPPVPIDQNVLDKIHNTPRAKQIINKEISQPSIQELRQRMDIGSNVSDEEFLLRYGLKGEDVDNMLSAGI